MSYTIDLWDFPSTTFSKIGEAAKYAQALVLEGTPFHLEQLGVGRWVFTIIDQEWRDPYDQPKWADVEPDQVSD